MKTLLITALILTSSPLLAQNYTANNWQHFQKSQQQKQSQQYQTRRDNTLRQVSASPYLDIPMPQTRTTRRRAPATKCVVVGDKVYCQ